MSAGLPARTPFEETIQSMSVLPRPDEKAAVVQTMFDRIAPDYDRMNRLLTFGTDQRWRKSLVRRLEIGPSDRVLDLASGTGDFASVCVEAGAEVIALDFSRGMLLAATRRDDLRGTLVQGDALALPLPNSSVTAAVSGFALRNFVEIEPAFRELGRVIQPGGRLGLLEVDRPRSRIIAAGHHVYFDRVVPIIGGILSDGTAYRYLPESASYLPNQADLVAMLVRSGFHRIQKRSHLFGAAQSITAVRK